MKDEIKRARAYLTGEGLGPLLLRWVAGAGAVRIAAMVASFAVGVQLARGLGVRDYGYYGLALSIIMTAALPAEMGLTSLVTREVAAAAARNDETYIATVVRWVKRTAATLSGAIAVTIMVGALAAQVIAPSPMTSALLVGSLAIPFSVLARVEGGALQGLHHLLRGQIPANLLPPVAMSLTLLCIATFGLRLNPTIAMSIYMLAAGGGWALAHSWLKPRLPKAAPAKRVQHGRRWISSMIPMALSDGLFALQVQVCMLLLGILASPEEVGLFRISAAIATVLSAPQTIMLAVSLPLISRLHEQKDHRRLQKMLTRCAQVQFAGVLLLVVPLFIAPGPIISAVFGQEFAPAADALRIMLAAQLISAGFGLNAQLLNMTHHERQVTRALAIALVLNIVAFAALVPKFGIIGAATAYLISMTAWNAMTWASGRKRLGLDTSMLPLRTGGSASEGA